MQSSVEEKVRKALGVLENEKVETPAYFSAKVLAAYDLQQRSRRWFFVGQMVTGLLALGLVLTVDPVALSSGRFAFRSFSGADSGPVVQASLSANVGLQGTKPVLIRAGVGTPVSLRVSFGAFPSADSLRIEMQLPEGVSAVGATSTSQLMLQPIHADGMLLANPSVIAAAAGQKVLRFTITSPGSEPLHYEFSVVFE